MVRHEDLRALSFPNNSFDLVLSAEVFEHIPEPYVALNEVFRVLKPGGSYVWTVPMNTNLQSKDTQLSMLNAAGQRFDAADPAIKAPQFHGDPMAPEGGIVVFQIFGAGELLPKMCEIGFGSTQAYSTYSKKYGIVAPGGVITMIARKPRGLRLRA
jgi:SAM-dependent methyltransferase